jgi:hypothetical protein
VAVLHQVCDYPLRTSVEKSVESFRLLDLSIDFSAALSPPGMPAPAMGGASNPPGPAPPAGLFAVLSAEAVDNMSVRELKEGLLQVSNTRRISAQRISALRRIPMDTHGVVQRII